MRKANLRDRTKLLLVWPKNLDSMIGVPLGYAFIAGNCDPEQVEVAIIDCMLEGYDNNSPELYSQIEKWSPDVLGLSCSALPGIVWVKL